MKDIFFKQIDNIKDETKKEMYTRCIGGEDCLLPENLKTNAKYYVCFNCNTKLTIGKVPEMFNENSFQTFKLKNLEARKVGTSLSPLEMMLIARNYPFQLIFNAPV